MRTRGETRRGKRGCGGGEGMDEEEDGEEGESTRRGRGNSRRRCNK
jgi:hypothetical protein